MSKNQTITLKDFPFIDEKGIHFASELWQTSQHAEENTMPSMVEECYNPSIADILANPSLAAHTLTPHYEDDAASDEVPTEWDNDIQDLYNLGGSQGDEPTLGKPTAIPKPASEAQPSPQAQEEPGSEIGSKAGEPEGAQRPSDKTD